LKGKVAVVTGASSGIGKAIALDLAGRGAKLYVSGRDPARTAQTASEIKAKGGAAFAEAFDVCDIEKLQAFIARAAKESDGLHIMCNAAGLEFPGAILSGDPKKWREVLETNVLSVLVGSQAAVKAMRQTKSAGHIVTISSIAAQRKEGGVYAASKIAVNFIMATLREELENDSIRTVTIMPGAVGTNFARNFQPEFVAGFLKAAGIEAKFAPGQAMSDDVIAQLNDRMQTVLASPQDIANAVTYAVTQPPNLNVAEIVVRPGKSIALPRN
jgi:NADP-dependent 3-hydroxy acid dehydrogenase YdfG